MLKFYKSIVLTVFALLLFYLSAVPVNIYAAGSRISNFKATTDPAAANPKNYAKTFTFTFTAQAGDPALDGFKVECGTATSGSKLMAKTIKDFKCEYPKDPATPYTVRLTPLASGGGAIGDPATITVQEKEPTKPADPTKPTPKPTTQEPKEYKDVLTGFGIKIENPSNETDIMGVVSKIINWMFLVLAMAATIMIIYSGLMLIFNGGDQSRVAKGKSTLTWAVLGLVISLGAFALVNIIQGLLQ